MAKKTFLGKLFRKPQNILPQIAMGIAAPFTGGLSLLGSAAYGGYRGYREAERAGASPLMGGLGGALGGYGLGMAGAGLGGMLSSALARPAQVAGYQATAQAAAPAEFGGYSWVGGKLVPSAAAIPPSLGLGTALTSGFTAGAETAGQQIIQPLQKLGLFGGEGAAGAAGAGAAGAGVTGAGVVGAGRGALDLSNPMLALGLTTLAGAEVMTSPTPPQVGPTVSKWLTADAITEAGKKAKEFVETEWGAGAEFNVDAETQAFMEVQEKDIRKTYKLRRTELDKMALAVNQQWMRSGERLEMHRRIQEEEQMEVDRVKSEWLINARQNFGRKQFDYVMGQLEVDEAVKRDLLYADLADVVWRYNVEQEDVLKLREIAQNAGLYMLQQGMGV